MPNYPFTCDNCMHEQDFVMSFKEYKEKKDSIKCPECGDPMRRQWEGLGVAPAIKTEFRMEDYWKKNNILDPEDPAYAKAASERIKIMRDKAKKKKEKEIERLGDKAKFRRIKIKSDDRDIKDLPGSHTGQVSVDKPKKDE